MIGQASYIVARCLPSKSLFSVRSRICDETIDAKYEKRKTTFYRMENLYGLVGHMKALYGLEGRTENLYGLVC